MSTQAPPPAPLAFAAYCCRWGWGADAETIRSHAAKISDWDLQLRVIRRNRIEGLVEQSLKQSEAKIPEAALGLRAAAAQIANENLRIAEECRRITHLFSESGIPILFFKGLTVAQLAYGNILTKSGWDIDVLIDRNDLWRAIEQIRALGYSNIIPQDSARLDWWHRVWRESVWKHPQTGLVIELHTRLADNPFLIPGITIQSPCQEVVIAKNISLRTLATDELFAYLCVHGASSGWFRLKWIADVAAMLSRGNAAETDRLYERSQTLGAGRAAGLALLLARWLFSTPVSDSLLKRISDHPHLRLFHLSVKTFTGAALAKDPTAVRFGTLPIHYSQFLLQRRLAFKAAQAWRFARTLRVRLALESAGGVAACRAALSAPSSSRSTP